MTRDVELCFTPQNIGKFWNVSTRSLAHNGFGLSIQETDTRVQAIEQTMTILFDDERVYRTWRGLLISHNVHGVQVHDAHIAASLEVHGISQLLTMIAMDFKSSRL